MSRLIVFTRSKSVQWFQRYSLLDLWVFFSPPPPFTTNGSKKPYATRELKVIRCLTGSQCPSRNSGVA